MNTPIRSIDRTELAAWLKQRKLPAFRARQIQEWIDRRFAMSFEEMSNLPKELRELLADKFSACSLEPQQILRADDKTVKWLSALADGATIETVLIRAPRRDTVCISTQVGCPVRCIFCESGRHGFVRDLKSWEIIDQVAMASHEVGKLVDNIVVMGTGEPLENLDNLLPALETICDGERGFGLGARHITISTSGLPAGIRRLAEQGKPWNLALSLHAPNDALRSCIIPDHHRHKLADILSACQFYREQTGRMLTFEYTLVAGLNDSEKNARDLAKLARNMRAKVNLIPCNAGNSRCHSPKGEWCEHFLDILVENGVQATLRRKKGDRIQAACGQLRAGAETKQRRS